MAKPDLTLTQFLDIAGSFEYDDPALYREGWNRYSEESRRLRAEEYFGANWGQHLVMHNGDHEYALTVLLGRKPTYLQVLQSLSGRKVVQETGTTGMGTINAAKLKFEAQAGSGNAEVDRLKAQVRELQAQIEGLKILMGQEKSRADALAQRLMVAKKAAESAKAKVTSQRRPGGAPLQALDSLILSVEIA